MFKKRPPFIMFIHQKYFWQWAPELAVSDALVTRHSALHTIKKTSFFLAKVVFNLRSLSTKNTFKTVLFFCNPRSQTPVILVKVSTQSP